MEDRTDEQANDDEEQHIGDALAAEDFAEKVRREDEQTDDGDGQSDLSRWAVAGDLFCDRVDQTRVGDGFWNLRDRVVDSRKRVGGGYEVGLHHDSMLLVEQSPVDTNEDAAVAHGVVGRDERVVVARE